jgi:dihydrofolate reductase
MGKLVVTEFVSLDGVFEDPGGSESFEHGGWTFTFDRGVEGDQFKLAELEAADAQLLGRRTYQGFAKAWPSITDEVGFADKMNNMPKYVVSATLANAEWTNSTVLRGPLDSEVPALKARHAGDILVAGSGQLIGGLMQHDLVDEFRLMVFPIVLGTGRRLFTDKTPTTRLALVNATPIGPDGVTILTYSRTGDPR